MLGQIAGAFIAIALLLLFMPENDTLGQTLTSVGWPRALGIEITITAVLMFVIFSVATDARAEGGNAAIAIGGTVALAAGFAGPLTGASMNPARSLAPAIAAGELTQLWIYLLGPTAGAIIGASGYLLIRCEGDLNNANGCC